MEADYILPKVFLNSLNIFTSTPTPGRSCLGPRLACGPSRRAWATWWWSSRHWSPDPPRWGPPPGALTTDHCPCRSGKQVVKKVNCGHFIIHYSPPGGWHSCRNDRRCSAWARSWPPLTPGHWSRRGGAGGADHRPSWQQTRTDWQQLLRPWHQPLTLSSGEIG